MAPPRFVVILIFAASALFGGTGVCRSEPDGMPLDGSELPYWRSLKHSCGPLCGTFLTCYFGKPVSYEYFSTISTRNAGGVSLAGLASALDELGYVTIPFEVSDLNALARLKCPAILVTSAKHFVVVVGEQTARERIHVYNPPLSLQALTYDDLRMYSPGKRGLAVLESGANRSLDSVFRPQTSAPLRSLWLLCGIGSAAVLVVVILRIARTKARARDGYGAILLLVVLQSCELGSGTGGLDSRGAHSEKAPADVTLTRTLGTVMSGQPLQCVFEIRNNSASGKEIVKAVFVKTCVCNSGQVDVLTASAEPGGLLRVQLTSAAGMKLGEISRMCFVDVVGNDATQRMWLELHATVCRPVRSVPSALNFGVFHPTD